MALNAIINNTERLGKRVKKYNFRCSVMLKRQKSSHTGNFKLAFKNRELCRVRNAEKGGTRKEEE